MNVDTLNTPVVIVGAGLAGLTAARRLHQAGVDFLLLEARLRLGDRILSADVSGAVSVDGFDLGPSWFWLEMHPEMSAFVSELGLASFPQHSDGDVVIHRMHHETPYRYRGMRQEPESMRLVGGTAAIIFALASSIPQCNISLGTRVTRVACNGAGIEVNFVNTDNVE